METITQIFETIFNDLISCIFTIGIISVVFWIVLWDRSHSGRLYRSGPALLTTLGVLGTFTGIFVGLLGFNVKDIDASVPILLEGMKTAFWTSVLGMFFAIALRFIQAFWPAHEDGPAEVTPEVIHGVLESIRKAIDKASSLQSASLEDLRKSISADSDSSLLTQLQVVGPPSDFRATAARARRKPQ